MFDEHKAREKALSLVGQGYIYGAKGQICSPAFRQQQAEQYPDQAERIMTTGERWDGVPVWDCAQLTRACAKEAGFTLPSGATSQWTKAEWAEGGEIGTIPEGRCVFVYRRQAGSTTVMAHTGIALGDGTCVHARGTAYGVVRQRMDEHAWTHWASPVKETGGKKQMVLYKAKLTAESGKTVNIRNTPGGTVRERLAIGTEVSVLREPENGWVWIEYEGGTAYVAEDFVRKVHEGDDLITLSLPRSAAQALLDAFTKGLG